MAFTNLEIAEHALTLEKHFWSRRRPPLHLRDKVREGQRFKDQSIELFYLRPAFQRPGESENSIAKIRYIRSGDRWRIFWKRANGNWYAYPLKPEVKTLAAALRVIDEDAAHCFFG
ncbi:MAG TPA: DUF3024 domain-containing protein [Candidatus Limnocylindria bacterium]|nr:DUF3024 domain-containing protein [Candidatus Limnocylindria bacterium]